MTQPTAHDHIELDSTDLMTDFAGSSSRHPRSTEMHTMYEALAREHLRELHHDARQRALYRELRARKRPRSGRRTRRSTRAAALSAVAD